MQLDKVYYLREIPLEKIVKFLATSQGRDKLYRLVQYFSRFLTHYLSKTSQISRLFIKRLQNLSKVCGMSRKLFRIGRPLECVQTIIRSGNIKDELAQTLTVCKAIGFGGWLTLDMFQWIHANDIIRLSPAALDFVNSNAPRLWLFGLISSLTLNLHKIKVRSTASWDNFKTDSELIQNAKDTLQDLVDMVIPLSLMGSIDVSSGVVGLAGTFTSILSITSLWAK